MEQFTQISSRFSAVRYGGKADQLSHISALGSFWYGDSKSTLLRSTACTVSARIRARSDQAHDKSLDCSEDHKFMPLSETEIFVYGTLWTTVWGLIVWFGKDKIVSSRDRKARKTTLLAFLNVWASEVSANRRKVNANNVFVTVAGEFDQKRLELIRQVTPIESDFRGRKLATFNELVDTISSMTPGSVEGQEGREKLLKAIRNLIAFVK